ncbi:MAG: hypothetical protein DDT38_00742 [Firmicutes bacterium]|nr:hypothetical protein [candidate division NPL-UPA2 bacterium]
MDAVAPRERTDKQHAVAESRRFAARELVLRDRAYTHGIDQAIAGIALVKIHFSPHGGDP